MTTTYELYTNENGTPKLVEGKAPAIVERVENLENAVGSIDVGVTSVNGATGDVTVDVGVTSFNGEKGAVSYSAPVTSVDGKTGVVNLSDTYQPKGNYLTSAPVTSVMGKTGAVTGLVTSVNNMVADASGNVTLSVSSSSAYQIPYATCSTAGNKVAKVATISNGVSLSLVAGAMVAVKFSKAPTALSTLNVNSTGAKTIQAYSIGGNTQSGTAISFSLKPANSVYVFVYDGTYWNFVSVYASGAIPGYGG